jgi:hypothetical protein
MSTSPAIVNAIPYEGETVPSCYSAMCPGYLWEKHIDPCPCFSESATRDLSPPPSLVPAGKVFNSAVLRHPALFVLRQNSRKGEWAPNRVRGRRALELGAGMGLGGMALALLGAIVVSTDVEAVMPLLRLNYNNNLSPSSLRSARTNPALSYICFSICIV